MKNSTSIVQPTIIINAVTDHKPYIFCKLHTHKIIISQHIKINLELIKKAVVRARARQKSQRTTPPNYKWETG